MDFEKKIIDIVRHVMELPTKKITIDSTAEDIEEWDSLRHINLVLALEEEFQVRFTPEQISQLLSIKKIIETLRSISTSKFSNN